MKNLLASMLLLPMLAFGRQTITLSEENSINFNEAFSSEYVAKKQVEAMNKCPLTGSKEIYIVLYSPGGSISAGKLFFDTLNALPCKFHTITIFSASMAYQTVQQLGKRYILPSGILMSHRASVGGLRGELGGELDSIIGLIRNEVRDMEIVASKRVGITLEKYKTLIRDELWLTAHNAVNNNHADEIVLARCDNSLTGTYSKVFNTFFGKFRVTFSKCPLVTGALSVGSANYVEVLTNETIIKFKKYLRLERTRVRSTF